MAFKFLKRKNHIKEGLGDRVFYGIILVFMVLVLFITLYPFIYVLSMSLSAPEFVLKQQVWLFPKGFTLNSYKLVLQENGIWTAYGNTIIYTVLGTLLNVVLTIMLAYPLSKKRFTGRSAISFFVTITMLFNGGMIPNFLLMKNLGLYNNRLAMIIPGAIGVYNMIIARNFFEGLPDGLEESASIDGANDLTILLKIIIPVSMPIIAVLTLFYAITHWNTYFNALLYLPNTKLQPLQMYLVRLLVQNQELVSSGAVDGLQHAVNAMQTKYATIIIIIIPILCVYPLLQKYFVKGVMVGALKG